MSVTVANVPFAPNGTAGVVRRLRMSDGVEIAVHDIPPMRTAFAHAVVLHGTGMHSKVYFSFAKLLSAQGIYVSLIDQRGHGLSGGEPGQVEHVMQYAEDLQSCLHQLASLQPELPLFVLAHSGGSAIALKALPSLNIPLSGFAMLAPTLAHDPLMARRRTVGRSSWRDWRYGVATRAPRAVHDDGHSAMQFHLGTFALARLLHIGSRRPALVCESSSPDGPSFVYSSTAVAASMISSTDVPLAHVCCPVLLATGGLDVFVNDATVHLTLPWMLAPHIALRAYSYPGADHFTTLFHAVRDILSWMRVCTMSEGLA